MSSMKQKCDVCGEGLVSPCMEMVPIAYKDCIGQVCMHYLVCDTCKSDFAGADESRMNKREITSYKKNVDGLLKGSEIKAVRIKRGLTQDQASRLCGGGPVAFSKYENDDVMQSESMDALLRLIGKSDAAFSELVNLKHLASELDQKNKKKRARMGPLFK